MVKWLIFFLMLMVDGHSSITSDIISFKNIGRYVMEVMAVATSLVLMSWVAKHPQGGNTGLLPF
jgi:hypothetical protein